MKIYIEDINSNGIDIYETDCNERKYYDAWCFNDGENLSDVVEVLNDNESTIRDLYDDCVEVEQERDKYKAALEEIITPNQSTMGDYPVLKSDVECNQIAKKALEG